WGVRRRGKYRAVNSRAAPIDRVKAVTPDIHSHFERMVAFHPGEIVRAFKKIFDVQIRAARTEAGKLLRAASGRSGVRKQNLWECLGRKRIKSNSILFGKADALVC